MDMNDEETTEIWSVGASFPMRWDDLISEDGFEFTITAFEYELINWYEKKTTEDIDAGEMPERPDGVRVETIEDSDDQYDLLLGRGLITRDVIEKVVEVLNEHYDENYEFIGIKGQEDDSDT